MESDSFQSDVFSGQMELPKSARRLLDCLRCEIPLTGVNSVDEKGQQLYAYCSLADYELVSQCTWHVANGYARTTINGQHVMMHHLVYWGAGYVIGEEWEVDHRDRNKLRNIRCNLRLVTRQQNNLNRNSWGASGYRGVCWHKRHAKWQAKITRNGKITHLGYFGAAEEAALAYLRASDEWAANN